MNRKMYDESKKRDTHTFIEDKSRIVQSFLWRRFKAVDLELFL